MRRAPDAPPHDSDRERDDALFWDGDWINLVRLDRFAHRWQTLPLPLRIIKLLF